MRSRRRLLLTVGSAMVLLTSGCGDASSAERAGAPTAAAPAGLVATPVTVPAGLAGAPFDEPRQVLTPPGWSMSLWARVPGARLAAWTPDGALLVSRPGAGQVVRLAPGSSGQVTSSVLLDGLDQPHGLAFDGTTLYVAESDQVDAYTYAGGATSGRRTVADGLPDAKSAELGGAYAHALKSVTVGPDRSIYYSVGSTGNISGEDRDAVPQRAVIMRIPPAGGAPTVFARGVRNGTGLAIAPDGSVWTAVNNRDNIEYPYDRSYSGGPGSDLGEVVADYVEDHPVEELARLTPGRDLGWPYCNPDGDVEPGVPGTAVDYTAPKFVVDVQTNPGGGRLDCAALAPVEQTFGAHSAPLGLSVLTGATLPAPYTAGALVGIHGSWNRTPPRAPEVSFFPWVHGTFGAQRTLVGGFQAADGSRWGRPVAAVQGPDRAVYITDDSAGAVYRLVPPGR
ncbi:MAG TPA: gluconolaconase [Pseudonocardia sp.]|jgi:glucose/arabinose dehydrogenase|nr:gluconolaconase [Pseudonocardia sp.]